MAFLTAQAGFQIKRTVFTVGGTFTVDPKVIWAEIECIGAGGGSGGVANFANWLASGGGGSGAYAKKQVSRVLLGASQTVTIGTGGTGGGSGGTNGGNGGSTSVGSLCVANGGSGSVGVSANTRFNQGGAGGVGGTGDIVINGMQGFWGWSPAAAAQGVSGEGGSLMYAVGGAGLSSAGSGNAGVNGGGAGGANCGAGASIAGAAGGNGYVVITEYLTA